MPSFKRPGVYVEEVLNRVNTTNGVSSDAVGALIGTANRGPTVPTLLNTWQDFVDKFGGFGYSTYLADAVFQYFVNGGSALYCGRVAPSDTALATRVLKDNGASGGQNTLAVNAINPGAWANGTATGGIFIDINAQTVPGSPTTRTGLFDLFVHFGSAAASTIVERFPDLSMDPTNARYAPRVINPQSQFIQVVDQSSTTAAPDNVPLTQSGTALASGVDGVAALAASDYQNVINGLQQFSVPVVLNLPGVTSTTILNSILSYVDGNVAAFLVVDPASGLTPATAVSGAAALTPTTGFAATYWPWLVVNDPSKSVPGITKTIPPGGAVVGQIIATDSAKGPFKTPAGVNNVLSGVVDLAYRPTDSDLDTLYSSQPPVNPIRIVNGVGPVLWGGRTLKSGTPDRYINVRRSLIYLERTLNNLTRFAVFENNDTRLWATIRSVVTAFLTQYFQRGGLAGDSPADAFYVTCDGTINTPAQIQQGVVNIEVGVALQNPAEFVVIRLGQFQGGSSTSTTQF